MTISFHVGQKRFIAIKFIMTISTLSNGRKNNCKTVSVGPPL